MIRIGRKKRSFALSGTMERTILTEIIRETSTSEPTVQIIATAEGSPDQEVTIHRLLSSLPDVHGVVSVALPLHFFEIVSVSIPVMPEEAIGKALPYHLAKTLAKPLPDFIYDWQLNRRNKDNLEITACLFPAATFNTLRAELAHKQLEIKYLEPDVFAAFAYLDLTGRLPFDQTTLCTLIWPGYSSHAVYEKGKLKMLRSVPCAQPPSPYPAGQEIAGPDGPEESPPAKSEKVSAGPGADIFGRDGDNNSIFADFSLSAVENEVLSTSPAAEFTAPESAREEEHGQSASSLPAADWHEYINNLGLEIIRTTDFYGLILKGSNIKHFFLGGGDEFNLELNSVTKSAIGLESERLYRHEWSQDMPAPLEAICIGTGAR